MPFRVGGLRPTGASRMFTRPVESLPPRRAGAIAALALATIVGLAINSARVAAEDYPNKFDFGEAATRQDIANIAIAIPSDGRGLPPGAGDYARGKQVFETACAACHGTDLKGVTGLPDMPSGAALRLVGG